MSCGSSRRGGDRGGEPPWPPSKTVDLSNFGKINKFGPVIMGPSSAWVGKKDAGKRDSTLTRVNSSSNMFVDAQNKAWKVEGYDAVRVKVRWTTHVKAS
jgi:hypothetical protein